MPITSNARSTQREVDFFKGIAVLIRITQSSTMDHTKRLTQNEITWRPRRQVISTFSSERSPQAFRLTRMAKAAPRASRPNRARVGSSLAVLGSEAVSLLY